MYLFMATPFALNAYTICQVMATPLSTKGCSHLKCAILAYLLALKKAFSVTSKNVNLTFAPFPL